MSGGILFGMARKNKDVETETPPIPPPASDPLPSSASSDDITVETAEPAAPPPWIPSAEIMPQWVVVAQRRAWKVKDGAAAWKDAFGEALPSTEMRAQWRGGDVEYSYFKSGKVLARFRPDSQHGEVFGVLQTEPVTEFEKDPEPPAATP